MSLLPAVRLSYQLVARIWSITLLFILLVIPAGLISHMRLAAQFQASGPGTTCSWIGILYFAMILTEVYLLLIFLWLQLLRGRYLHSRWHLAQLILIFLLGVVPGVLMLYPLFIK